MYCSNCGNQMNENADFCVKCGVMVKNKTIIIKEKKQSVKDKSIISMVLGITALFFALISFDIEINLIDLTLFKKVGFILSEMALQIILAILSLIFGLVERKNNKNGYNLSGIILSLITFCLSAILFLFIVAQ